MMHGYQNGCVAVIGSMTQALRAQRALAGAAIPAEIIKADARDEKRGCAYALSYSCAQENNVKTVLGNQGIRVRRMYGRGEA